MDTEKISPHMTAKIVRGYVRHHRLGPDQLPDLIASIHRALGQLGQQVQPAEVPTPAVSIRQSVRHDYVVCVLTAAIAARLCDGTSASATV